MTFFNKRREARASYLMRNVALCGAARHQNQQAFRNVWLDNEVIKKNMWRAEADIPGSWGTHALEAGDSPLMDRWRRGETAAAGRGETAACMDMTEEAYRNLPRSNKVERRAAKAIDNLKMGCAQGLGCRAGLQSWAAGRLQTSRCLRCEVGRGGQLSRLVLPEGGVDWRHNDSKEPRG